MAWIKDFISSGGGGGKFKAFAAIGVALLLIIATWHAGHNQPPAQTVSAAPPAPKTLPPLPQNQLVKPPEPLPQQALVQPPVVPPAYPQFQMPTIPPPNEDEKDDSPLGISYRSDNKAAAQEEQEPSGYANQPAVPQAAPPVPLSPENLLGPDGKKKPDPVTITDGQGHSSTLGSTYLLPRGSIIECVLETRLDGTFAGPLKAQVSEDVYSHDREHVILPAGAVALGLAKEVRGTDSDRLSVDFDTLAYWQNNKYVKVSLDDAIGLDQQGATALKDKTNHHLVPMIAAATAMGLLGGLTLSGTGSALTASGWDLYRQGVAQQVGMTGNILLERFMNLRPNITIREGTRIKMFFPDDLKLPAVDFIQ